MSIFAKVSITILLSGLFLLTPKAASAGDDGSFMRTLIPAAAYGATFYMHDRDGRGQFYKSFFTNLGATYALKALIGNERPNGQGDDSFPSGHTSVAFQGAAFIHKRYGFKYAAAAYAAAAYVGWRRVATDNHYTVDAVAGAAIGIASSLVFTRPYRGFEVTPLAVDGAYGLALGKRW